MAQAKTSQRAVNILDLDLSKPFRGQVTISGEEAALLLPEYNVGNRRRRANLVLYLQRQIWNGEWQPDHPQPIVFSDKGRLIDGQHRLFAIAESRQTVVANVVTGVRDDLREYIDTGISRQLEDRVAFSNDHAENKRIAMLVNHWFIVDRASAGGTGGHGIKPTPDEARNLFEAHKAATLFVAQRMASKQRGLTTVPVMVALAQFYERHDKKAERFSDALLSPDGDIQPARRLREFLIAFSARGNTGGASARMTAYMRAVSAMRAYMADREVVQLRNASWAD